jgi:hypothetical protein
VEFLLGLGWGHMTTMAFISLSLTRSWEWETLALGKRKEKSNFTDLPG